MHDQIKSIFLKVVEQPASERPAMLDRLCAGDAELRGRVEALLAALDQAKPADFLATLHPSQLPTVSPAADLVGQRIGPYKLLQKIGEGGFGTVYMAEQESPIRRKVALKVIKPGMDSRQVIGRFEAERQALALMDHPHIARVLDGGLTDDHAGSRPYFVMEYVVGDAINAFADAHRLTLPERLRLFEQVCSAVQHAHTKGIIHRDLKPANVLVSMVDGKPFAKVIDFGIAKATGAAGGRLTDKTFFTEHRQLIGTPEYMSPEQAEGNLDIDTRTDVYALGVLLYELLTGTTPIEPKRLRSAAIAEVQRIIKEEEPLAPSLKLSRSLDTLASTAATRKVEPGKLSGLLKGELDWIVLKALEKERARRYETASALADDVRRHLVGEAVVAAPVSRGYRVRKFVRRNRGAVIAGSAVAGALLVGISGMAWGLAQSRAANADLRRLNDQAASALSGTVARWAEGAMHTGIDEGLGAIRLQSDPGYQLVPIIEDELSSATGYSIRFGKRISEGDEVTPIHEEEVLPALADTAVHLVERLLATMRELRGQRDALAEQSRIATESRRSLEAIVAKTRDVLMRLVMQYDVGAAKLPETSNLLGRHVVTVMDFQTGKPVLWAVDTDSTSSKLGGQPVADDQVLPMLADLVQAAVRESRQAAERLERERDAAEWSAYIANLALAEAALEGGSYPEARRRLMDAPLSKRGWEWAWRFRLASEVESMTKPIADASVPKPILTGPEGTRLTLATDRSLRLIPRTNNPQSIWMGYLHDISDAGTLSPDGRFAVTDHYCYLMVWDAVQGLPLAIVGRGDWSWGVRHAFFSSDSRFLEVIGGVDTLSLEQLTYNLATIGGISQRQPAFLCKPGPASGNVREQLRVNAVLTHFPNGPTYTSPDGTRRIVGGTDKTIRFYEAKDGKPTLPATAASPDGVFREVAVFRMPEAVTNLQMTGDGTRLIIHLADGSARVWDIRDPEERRKDLQAEWAERVPAGAYLDALWTTDTPDDKLREAVVNDASLTPLRRLVAAEMLAERLEDDRLAAEQAFDELKKMVVPPADASSAPASTALPDPAALKAELHGKVAAAELPKRVHARAMALVAEWEYAKPQPSDAERLAEETKRREEAELNAAALGRALLDEADGWLKGFEGFWGLQERKESPESRLAAAARIYAKVLGPSHVRTLELEAWREIEATRAKNGAYSAASSLSVAETAIERVQATEDEERYRRLVRAMASATLPRFKISLQWRQRIPMESSDVGLMWIQGGYSAAVIMQSLADEKGCSELSNSQLIDIVADCEAIVESQIGECPWFYRVQGNTALALANLRRGDLPRALRAALAASAVRSEQGQPPPGFSGSFDQYDAIDLAVLAIIRAKIAVADEAVLRIAGQIEMELNSTRAAATGRDEHRRLAQEHLSLARSKRGAPWQWLDKAVREYLLTEATALIEGKPDAAPNAAESKP